MEQYKNLKVSSTLPSRLFLVSIANYIFHVRNPPIVQALNPKNLHPSLIHPLNLNTQILSFNPKNLHPLLIHPPNLNIQISSFNPKNLHSINNYK